MSEENYQLLVTVCLAVVLLLSPFAGIHRAVRRLRAKAESSTAPVFAGVVVAADAIAGLAGLFEQPVALLAVLLAVIWLVAALASNGLVRRAKAKAAARAAALPPEPPPSQQL